MLRKQFGELFLAESVRRVLKFVRISVAERKDFACKICRIPSDVDKYGKEALEKTISDAVSVLK